MWLVWHACVGLCAVSSVLHAAARCSLLCGSQRLGPDGYELFGGQLKVKPGDDGEGEVLMATLAQSTGGTSIDGDDGDAVGDAQGLEDDGEDDGADDGGAGDVVEADPSQANLSTGACAGGGVGLAGGIFMCDEPHATPPTASFTVTTDHAALADAIARAAAIRERGGRSPAHDDGVSSGKHEEDDLVRALHAWAAKRCVWNHVGDRLA